MVVSRIRFSSRSLSPWRTRYYRDSFSPSELPNEATEVSVDAEKLLKKFPNIAESMALRAENYNQSLEFVRNPPKMRPLKFDSATWGVRG